MPINAYGGFVCVCLFTVKVSLGGGWVGRNVYGRVLILGLKFLSKTNNLRDLKYLFFFFNIMHLFAKYNMSKQHSFKQPYSGCNMNLPHSYIVFIKHIKP